MKNLLILLSFTFLLSGCSYFKASVGDGTSFQFGKLEGILEANVDRSDYAATRAIKKMELVLVSHKKDAFYSVFEAKNAKDQTVSINLSKISNKSTKIFIKVGWSTGDQPFSQALFDAVKENL